MYNFKFIVKIKHVNMQNATHLIRVQAVQLDPHKLESESIMSTRLVWPHELIWAPRAACGSCPAHVIILFQRGKFKTTNVI